MLLCRRLHAVLVDDYQAFREATQPLLRAAKLSDRFTASGLTVEDADALVPELLAFADQPRTAAEYEAWLEHPAGLLRSEPHHPTGLPQARDPHER